MLYYVTILYNYKQCKLLTVKALYLFDSTTMVTDYYLTNKRTRNDARLLFPYFGSVLIAIESAESVLALVLVFAFVIVLELVADASI